MKEVEARIERNEMKRHMGSDEKGQTRGAVDLYVCNGQLAGKLLLLLFE